MGGREGMNVKQYREHPAVNFSSLKHILTSPSHYKAALDAPSFESKAMLIGTLTHAVALEGKKLADIAAVKPGGLNLATKEGKAWKADNDGKPIISVDEMIGIFGMAGSIMKHQHATRMLSSLPHRETPLLGNIAHVNCKCLLDAHGKVGDEWVIADLKTTDDASPDGFGRKAAGLHYDMQASFYSSLLAMHYGLESPPYWFWIAVEKTEPYTCAVYSFEEWAESGESKMMRALEKYRECSESGIWPGPDWSQGIQQLPKPRWA